MSWYNQTQTYRCIIGTSTTGFEEITICHNVGQSKIGNLDIVVGIQKQAKNSKTMRTFCRSQSLFWLLYLLFRLEISACETDMSTLYSMLTLLSYLCTILCRWQYSTAQMTCWKNLRASSSDIYHPVYEQEACYNKSTLTRPFSTM